MLTFHWQGIAVPLLLLPPFPGDAAAAAVADWSHTLMLVVQLVLVLAEVLWGVGVGVDGYD